MKRLALAIAALAAAQLAAAAGDDVEFKLSGELRARYGNWIDPAASSSNPASFTSAKSRARLSVAARRGERFQMLLSVQHGAEFGETAAVNNSDTGHAYYSGGAGDTAQVSRAWGSWRASDSFIFRVGRMGIELGDGTVFSENDWEQTPTMHEGLMAGYEMDFAKITAYAVKNEFYGMGANFGSPAWEPEQNMYLVAFDFKGLPEALRQANLNIAEITRDEADGAVADPLGSGGYPSGMGLNEQRVGASASGESYNVTYKVSAAYVVGAGKVKSVSPEIDYAIDQQMVDGAVGYRAPDLIGFKAALRYHRDSGNSNLYDPAVNPKGDQTLSTYDPLFYERHNSAGLMDVVRWGNLSFFELSASLTPAEDVEAGVAYYLFSRTETGAHSSPASFGPYYSNLLSGYATAAQASQVSDGSIGGEIDVFANKTYEGSYKIGAHFGMFTPGDYLKNAMSGQESGKQDQAIMQAMVQGTMSF
jgi:hypothetical protein